MAIVARSVVWTDANGYQTISRIVANITAGPVQAAILGCSNADFLQYWEGPQFSNISPSPTAAGYIAGSQVALLVYQCADGTSVQVRIPAPQLAIFLADGRTVDPANAAVLTLNAAVIGVLVSTTGSLATAYQSGSLLPYNP